MEVISLRSIFERSSKVMPPASNAFYLLRLSCIPSREVGFEPQRDLGDCENVSGALGREYGRNFLNIRKHSSPRHG